MPHIDSKDAPLYGPFAETTATGQSGWIDEQRQPLADRVYTMLDKLDGVRTFTYSIWRGNDPTSIIANRKTFDGPFIQAAGSSDAMTIEVRHLGDDNNMHLSVIGAKESPYEGSVSVSISQDHTRHVYENEVFTAEKAVKIFSDFASDKDLSIHYRLREINPAKR